MVLTDEWLQEARDDLNAELEYVYNKFGSQSAEKAYRKVVESIANLCRFPHLGEHFKDIVYREYEVRTLSMKQTSIIYCVREDKLLIIALWNNRRDDKTLQTMIKSRQ